MEYYELMSNLETYTRPLIEVKKYHVIGIPLDLAIPGTCGGITLLLSKFKKLKTVILTINRRTD